MMTFITIGQRQRDKETGEPDDATSITSGSEGGWEKRPAMDLARSLPSSETDLAFGSADERETARLGRITTSMQRLMEFLDYVRSSDWLREAIRVSETLGLQNYYVAGGAVTQVVWNQLTGVPIHKNIKDVDVVYFDSKAVEAEQEKLQRRRYRYLALCLCDRHPHSR